MQFFYIWYRLWIITAICRPSYKNTLLPTMHIPSSTIPVTCSCCKTFLTGSKSGVTGTQFLSVGACLQARGHSPLLEFSTESAPNVHTWHIQNGLRSMEMSWVSRCLAHRRLLWSVHIRLSEMSLCTNKTSFQVSYQAFGLTVCQSDFGEVTSGGWLYT